METDVMFLDCPAYLDEQGEARCGLPAEVHYRYTVRSTDGPLESAKIRCPRGHWFNGPMTSLTWNSEPRTTVLRTPARRAAAGPSRPGAAGS